MLVLDKFQQGLIVSCQPIDNGPMDSPIIVSAMAMAAQIGGASGLRIEGIDNVHAVIKQTDLPIIGIVKHDLEGYKVRITPLVEHIRQLAKAGAQVIAYDATLRNRPQSTSMLISAIHDSGCLAMADCANFSDASEAVNEGADIIGTTLSGYVTDLVTERCPPDFEFIQQLQQLDTFIMAEGRFNSPELAAKALQMGANAVTVGSAITRVENITRWFANDLNATLR